MKIHNTTSNYLKCSDKCKDNQNTFTAKAKPSQKQLILNALKIHGDCSSRMLAIHTGVERCSITSLLSKMCERKPSLIMISSKKECETTRKKVKYYKAK
jgi:hypothetical protein